MNPLVRRAELEAAKIIYQYGITEPADIRLKDIAFDLGASVIEGKISGAAANIVVIGNQATIRVNLEEAYPYRKRFSIGHELGHFVLKHGHNIQRVCSDSDLLSWYGGSEETQANAFAAELLLPTKLIEAQCDVAEVGFDLIRDITENFRVSLTAAAIRFVQFCPEPCAIVFSKKNTVKWFQKSESWWPFIKIGSPLDKGTFASLFFQDKQIPNEPMEVEGYIWIDGNKSPNHIIEHSIASPHLGFVLSLLWLELGSY